MRIAVIGAGGVGGGFGMALGKAGADVTFVARGVRSAARCAGSPSGFPPILAALKPYANGAPA